MSDNRSRRTRRSTSTKSSPVRATLAPLTADDMYVTRPAEQDDPPPTSGHKKPAR